jgi:hypothetical protein
MTANDRCFLVISCLCGDGGYPPIVLQPLETYFTKPPLVSPFHLQRCSTSTGVRDLLSAKGGTMGEKCLIKFSHTITTSTLIVVFFYMPQSCDMGPTALLPFRRKACWGFFRPKNPTASARFEPANFSGYLDNQSENMSPCVSGLLKFIHWFSILSDDRSKASSQNGSSTQCDLELPLSNESILSCP